jgi:hypothetical protein
MKVTRIKRELMKKIINSLPLSPTGSTLKHFEISDPATWLDLKTEGTDLLVYEFESLKEYEDAHSGGNK